MTAHLDDASFELGGAAWDMNESAQIVTSAPSPVGPLSAYEGSHFAVLYSYPVLTPGCSDPPQGSISQTFVVAPVDTGYYIMHCHAATDRGVGYFGYDVYLDGVRLADYFEPQFVGITTAFTHWNLNWSDGASGFYLAATAHTLEFRNRGLTYSDLDETPWPCGTRGAQYLDRITLDRVESGIIVPGTPGPTGVRLVVNTESATGARMRVATGKAVRVVHHA